jgi:tRNA pseudouridine55 synthase
LRRKSKKIDVSAEEKKGRTGERIKRRPVHGVLLLDKPIGLSSNDALQKAKWLLRAEKAGHTGTLDPLATGLLPLCFGAATKFSQLHLDADKRYEAIAALGVKTTTGDAEGDVIERREVQVNDELLQSVLQQFKGAIEQIPPMHSALKKDGKALYEYARAGIDIERIARKVQIHALTGDLCGKLHTEKEANLPVAGVLYAYTAIKLIVSCSKGTYIRTLGEDIGEKLGCGAHLSSLRRIGTGGFDVSQCVTLEQLEAMAEDERLACLLPVESLLVGHERVTLDAENTARFLNGVRRRGEWQIGKNGSPVAVFGVKREDQPEVLLGTAQVIADELVPGRLLSPQDIEQILENSN